MGQARSSLLCLYLTLFFKLYTTSTLQAQDKLVCMRGFFYAEEGRIDDFKKFIDESIDKKLDCMRDLRYEGLLLPHFIMEKKLSTIFPALVGFTGPNWKARYKKSDVNYTSLLELAFAKNNSNFYRYLIEKGANLDSPFTNLIPWRTPLQYAIENLQNESLAIMLTQRGANFKLPFRDIDEKGQLGVKYQASVAAIYYGYFDLIKLFLEKGLDPNTTSLFPSYIEFHSPVPLPLLAATAYKKSRQIDILKLMLESGADSNICSKWYTKDDGLDYRVCPVHLLEIPNIKIDDSSYKWLEMALHHKMHWRQLESEYTSFKRLTPQEVVLKQIKSIASLQAIEKLGLSFTPSKGSVSSSKNLVKILTKKTPQPLAKYILVDRGWYLYLRQIRYDESVDKALLEVLTKNKSGRKWLTELKKYVELSASTKGLGNDFDIYSKIIQVKDLTAEDVKWAGQAQIDLEKLSHEQLEKERKGIEKQILFGFFFSWFHGVGYPAASVVVRLNLIPRFTSLPEIEFMLKNAIELGDLERFNAIVDNSELLPEYINSIDFEYTKLKHLANFFGKVFTSPDILRLIRKSVQQQRLRMQESTTRKLMLVSEEFHQKSPMNVSENILLIYSSDTGAAFIDDWDLGKQEPTKEEGAAARCAYHRQKGYFIDVYENCDKKVEELGRE